MKNELKLISMDTVETETVQWLWYPYIPLGKITCRSVKMAWNP